MLYEQMLLSLEPMRTVLLSGSGRQQDIVMFGTPMDRMICISSKEYIFMTESYEEEKTHNLSTDIDTTERDSLWAY